MRIVLIFVLFISSLFAIGKYPSDIPLPKTEVIKMDTKYCNEVCMTGYLYRGQVFSFFYQIMKHYHKVMNN